MSRGFLGETPCTFGQSFSQGLSNSVSLIWKIGSNQSNFNSPSTTISYNDSINLRNSSVHDAQSHGATVHWEKTGTGGSLQPIAYYTDGSSKAL